MVCYVGDGFLKGLWFGDRGWWICDVGGGVGVDVVFKTNPSDECGEEGKVEKALVGDCEDNEDRRKGEEYYD